MLSDGHTLQSSIMSKENNLGGVRGGCGQDTLYTCMKFSKTKTFKNI